jgi:hypothetical protein
MNLELEAYEGELKDLREKVTNLEKYKIGYEAAMRIIKSTYTDHFPDHYFICGEGGEKDRSNLPKQIHVCPSNGVDWFQIYEKTDKTSTTEW